MYEIFYNGQITVEWPETSALEACCGGLNDLAEWLEELLKMGEEE